MKWHKSRWIVVVPGFIAVLSISYAVSQHFYYAKRSQRIIPDGYNPHIIGKPLPNAKLVDFHGDALGDGELRHGKVILVLLSSGCDACFTEGQFLKAIVAKYSNLRFYGAIVFGSARSVDNNIEGKFPMKLFFDQDSLLRRSLEVKAVPLKIFLEDGVVKKIWTGTAVTPEVEGAFVRDMEEISSNKG
jgi:hypothetical protein